MAVIISGVPTVGSVVEVVFSGEKAYIDEYTILSGISKTEMKIVQRGKSPYYTPSNSDRYIRAVITLTNGLSESSNIVAVIENELNSYEESKISVVGNGLSLTDVLPENVSGARVVSDVKRVSQSIFIILSTSLAEIPMLDTLGSTLPYHLFKEVTENSVQSLREAIETSLADQEPRINVTEVEIVYDGAHTLGCTIHYIITNTNIKSSYIYNVSAGD